jgi:hypothetical protein
MSGATSAAIIGAGALGAGASIIGGSEAASAQEAASKAGIAAEQGMFNTAVSEDQPFINTGQAALSQISGLEGLNGGNSSTIQSTLQGLPGYQFALQQGLKSTQNSATERGLGVSGASLKGAASYSTGLANQYYNNLLQGLQSTANTGEASAASLTGAATTTGSNIAQQNTNAGQAAAAGILSGTAGVQSAANSVPSALITGQLLQNVQNGGTTGIYGATNAGSAADQAAVNEFATVGGLTNIQ